MKKLKLKANAFQGNALSREQLKKVLGGVAGSDNLAGCTAKCRTGSVSCKGSGCSATDYVGCSSTLETRKC